MAENNPPRSTTRNWRQLVEEADPDWQYERHHPVIRRLPNGREMRLIGGAYDFIQPNPDLEFSPAPDALAVGGLAPALLINRDYAPATATLTIAGATPVLQMLLNLEPGPDSIVVTGETPTVLHQQAHNISPATATLAITGQQPDRTFGPNIQVNPGTATVALVGWAPDVDVQLNGTAFITPVDVTPATRDAWTDVDVSAHVPVSASGVIIHVDNFDSLEARQVGLRKKGSSDNQTGSLSPSASNAHTWGFAGLDADRVFQAYHGTDSGVGQGVRFWLVGYFTGDAVFFDNGVNKLPAATTGWQTVDISGNTEVDLGSEIRDDVAIGAIFEVQTDSISEQNLRRMGSSDERLRTMAHRWFIIGVDSSEQCEAYRASTGFSYLRLIGYIRSHWRFNSNAPDIKPALSGSTWTDLVALSNGAIGGVIEVNVSADESYGLRENGSSENITNKLTGNSIGVGHAVVECDGSRLIEGWAGVPETTNFYEIGVALSVASLNTELSPAPDTLVITGLTPALTTTSSNINLSPATATLTITGLAPSLPWNFGSDFETDETTLLSGLPYFDDEQLDNGSGSGAAVDIVTTAVTGMTGNKMRADAPLGDGKALWNADLVETYGEGDIVEMGCVFRFDSGETLSGAGAFCTIFDLEASTGSNPGIRVGSNSSKWSVNRKKIDSALSNYNTAITVNVGQTYTIELKMRLSTGGSGITKFYVDGVLIVDETGQNLHADGYSRTQWGATVNNTGDTLLRVYVDRVWFRTLESTAQL